jgi:RNA ligase
VHYEFPYISHLDEVREVIQELPEFIIAEREWGYVANYLVSHPDTFPQVKTAGGSAKMRNEASRAKAIRRECRGLIFDRNGTLISRPFHKFFNVNERDETQSHLIDLDQPHVILEKLDGSMVRPFALGNAYRLGTKMGITDVSMQAEVWVAGHANYHDFIMLHIERGQTLIFEWCSRKQRIVVDYPEDRLVLTAIRDINTGAYKSYEQMRTYAEAYGIDIVRQYEGTVANMQALLAETHDLVGQEGWIIRFADGHMLKIKGSEYVLQHKAKDSILRENGVIEMLLDEKLDDVKSVLDDDTRHRLEKFESAFWQGIAEAADTWKHRYLMVKAEHGADRKSFALDERYQTLDPNLKSAIFRNWDALHDADWRQAVVDTVRKNLGTQTKVDAIRKLFGNAKWDYGANGGDE